MKILRLKVNKQGENYIIFMISRKTEVFLHRKKRNCYNRTIQKIRNIREYTMESLYRKLKEYGEGDTYPFHMPGHKRNMGGYGF